MQRRTTKKKLDNFLCTSLKRQIRDLRGELDAKQGEVNSLKKNIKSTKTHELEVGTRTHPQIELKAYMDECVRLRHVLEELVRSRDPLADPDEVARIEEQFQQQQALLDGVKKENFELAEAYAIKEEDVRVLSERLMGADSRAGRDRTASKETKRIRKELKDRQRESAKMKQELVLLRSSAGGDIRETVDSMVKKQGDLQEELDGRTSELRAA